MSTPAEVTAARDGLPVIAATPQEFLRAASGHPIIVMTDDGGRALLRIATPAEMLAANERAITQMIADGADPTSLHPLTERGAELLARPLSFDQNRVSYR